MDIKRTIHSLEVLDVNANVYEAAGSSNFPKDPSVADAARIRFNAVINRYSADLHRYIDDLVSGSITPEDAINKMTSAMSNSMKKAYLAGKEFMTGVKSTINADDMAYLSAASEYEAGFIRNFVDDIVNGRGKMPYGMRADLYTGAITGAFNNAAVEYSPDDALIYWKLSVSEHCEDCITLSSMSPWTKRNLPTVPGAGDTKCGGKCKCTLEYVRSSKPADKSPSYRFKNASDIFKPADPPPGMESPDIDQMIAIESIRQEVNYWRRAIVDASEAGNEAAKLDAVINRKEANDKLIDYLEDNNLWSPPPLSVDDVISGRIFDSKLMESLFSMGVDGATIMGLSDEKFMSIIDDILDAGYVISAIVDKEKE